MAKTTTIPPTSSFPSHENHTLHLPKLNLTIAYTIYGALASPTAGTVFHFHGFPGCRIEGAAFASAATQRDLRIVSIDRPGMGESEMTPGPPYTRTFRSWSTDYVGPVASELGVEKYVVLGVSGGGPYALSCLLPEEKSNSSSSKCVGAAVVCGMEPISLGLAGMNFQFRTLLNLSAWTPTWLMEKMLSAGIPTGTDEQVIDMLDKMLSKWPKADREVWEEDRGNLKGWVMKSAREAMKNGTTGAAHEAAMYGSPFGFGFEELNSGEENEGRRVVMWHGREDINVPCAMTEKAGELIKGAELRINETDGHFSLVVNKTEEIIQTCREMLDEAEA